MLFFFFFSSRRRHTRCSRDWSSDVCSSDLRDRLFRAAYPVRLVGIVSHLLGILVRLRAFLVLPGRFRCRQGPVRGGQFTVVVRDPLVGSVLHPGASKKKPDGENEANSKQTFRSSNTHGVLLFFFLPDKKNNCGVGKD